MPNVKEVSREDAEKIWAAMISVSTELTSRVRIQWIRFRKLFHKHRYDIPGAEKIKVDLVGGHHTAFMILKCNCGAKVAFPEVNFRLAMQEGTDDTLKLLASFGFEG